jgi:streptomycin 6-kinase
VPVDDFPVPRNLIADDRRRGWVAALPQIVSDLADRWSLDEIGVPFQPGGQTAWAAPVRVGANFNLVLKVGWRHPEAVHEAAGLTEWEGQGAVRLYAAVDFEDTVALLLERCVPGTSLAAEAEPDQDLVIAALLRRLWIEPQSAAVFRPLQLMCEQWAAAFEGKMVTGRGIPDAGLAREGIELFRSLAATAEHTALLCTDLHAENVLAAEREPWLVIDPKPYLGDPTYDVLQHMLNCEERLSADPRGLALRMADLLDLDPERLVLWLFARCVQESPDRPMLAEVARRIAPG